MKMFEIDKFFDKNVDLGAIKSRKSVKNLTDRQVLTVAAWMISQEEDQERYADFATYVALLRNDQKRLVNEMRQMLMSSLIYMSASKEKLVDYNFPETFIDLDYLDTEDRIFGILNYLEEMRESGTLEDQEVLIDELERSAEVNRDRNHGSLRDYDSFSAASFNQQFDYILNAAECISKSIYYSMIQIYLYNLDLLDFEDDESVFILEDLVTDLFISLNGRVIHTFSDSAHKS